MSSAPLARLQLLSEEEKAKLTGIFRRRLIARAAAFSLMILTCIAVILYFNKYRGDYRADDNLEIINVVFVVILVIGARLLVSEILEYSKELKSTSKKVIRTRVLDRKDDKIVLGNKSFSKDQILLDTSDFDSLKGGDEVLLELSAKSNTIFSVKKVSKESYLGN